MSEYSEPLTLDDRSEWVPLNHSDFNFVLGLVARVYGDKNDNDDSEEIETKPYPLPKEVGSWFIERFVDEEDDGKFRRLLNDTASSVNRTVTKASNLPLSGTSVASET